MQRNKHLLLWTSLGTLLLLGWAAFAENQLQEWRVLQRSYREALPADRRAEFSIQLRQIVVPQLDAADRCVSCHVGMAPGEAGVIGTAAFAPHPTIAHDPSQFGCTICHGGQGRATTKADAHGSVRHWPEPMIPVRLSYAGCGTCHSHLAVPSLPQVERGRALFERNDCLACHRMEGRGGTLRPGGAGGMEGPDLSRAGVAGFDRAWHAGHEQQHAAAAVGPWHDSFAAVPADDRAAIDGFLTSRAGAPGLVEAKGLFHSLGCRGCHPIGGVGGDDGPDLTREGERDPGQLDFLRVPGERTLGAWLGEHFRSPAAVVPGSAMPALGLTEPQIEQLTFYLLSLRRRELPGEFWPKDRVLAERFGEREFASDGATLYGTFCAACHGPSGEGMRYAGLPAFPAIGNADFLAIASDDFLRANITHGRPGRRMPSWGEKEGGLRPTEIDTLVSYVRALGGGIAPPPESRPPRWVAPDARRGSALYADNCALCHGAGGEGKEGPALANRVLLAAATDTYLVETIRRGRRGTSMPPYGEAGTTHRLLADEEIEAIVAFMRTWEKRS